MYPGETSLSLELFFCATEHSPMCPMAQVYSVIEALISASWWGKSMLLVIRTSKNDNNDSSHTSNHNINNTK